MDQLSNPVSPMSQAVIQLKVLQCHQSPVMNQLSSPASPMSQAVIQLEVLQCHQSPAVNQLKVLHCHQSPAVNQQNNLVSPMSQVIVPPTCHQYHPFHQECLHLQIVVSRDHMVRFPHLSGRFSAWVHSVKCFFLLTFPPLPNSYFFAFACLLS